MTQDVARQKAVQAENFRQKRWAILALVLAPMGVPAFLYLVDQPIAAIGICTFLLLVWTPFVLHIARATWRIENGCLLLGGLRVPVSHIVGIERRALVPQAPQNLYAQFELVMQDGSRLALGQQEGGTGLTHGKMAIGAAAVGRSIEVLAAMLDLTVWEDPTIDPFFKAFADNA